MLSPEIEALLTYVNEAMRTAEYYLELMEAWEPEKSDPIEYENYFNTIDRVWSQLDESRELGEEGLEDNDEILDAWEAAYTKAVEVMSQIESKKLKAL